MGFLVLIGVVVQALINVQLERGIAMLTHTVLELLHVEATIAKEIFHQVEVIGIAPLIAVKVGKHFLQHFDSS